MLPLIPALILLLLKGPSHVERLAQDNAWPSEFDAIHQRAAGPRLHEDERARAIASLLAATRHADLGQALAALLTLPESEPAKALKPEPQAPQLALAEKRDSKVAEGFRRSQRSRDGPAVW